MVGDPHPEQGAQRSQVSAQDRPDAGVNDPGGADHDGLGARGGGLLQASGEPGVVDEDGGNDDEPVAAQVRSRIGFRWDDVGGDPGLPQAAVPGSGRLEALTELHRANGCAHGPLALPVQDDGRLGAHRLAQDRAEPFQGPAGGHHLVPGAAGAPGVGDHAGVEGLGALSGLAPLELQDAVGAVGHACQGPQEELSGAFG